jgi:hypothetical protein
MQVDNATAQVKSLVFINTHQCLLHRGECLPRKFAFCTSPSTQTLHHLSFLARQVVTCVTRIFNMSSVIGQK